MATHTIKTTYSLDVDTVRALDDLARRWNVSKSEALRRAIRVSWVEEPAAELVRTQALNRLQRSLGLTARSAARWASEIQQARKERSHEHESLSK